MYSRIGIFQITMLTTVFVVISVLNPACGATSDAGTETYGTTFLKINPDPTVRDLSSFDGARFKKSKEYDVSGLPLATAAYMVYFTPPGWKPVQYELRIYPDHSSAVESGIEYADEVTGVDALLRSVDVRWKEGTRDRRGGGASRGPLTPLYGDYTIIGNVIVLCEGRDPNQSLEHCAALLSAAGITVGDAD